MLYVCMGCVYEALRLTDLGIGVCSGVGSCTRRQVPPLSMAYGNQGMSPPAAQVCVGVRRRVFPNRLVREAEGVGFTAHRVGHRQRLLPNTPLRTVGKSREAQTPINSVGLPILPKRMSSRNLLVPIDNDSGDSESGEDRLRPLVSTQAGATPVYETTFRAFG